MAKVMKSWRTRLSHTLPKFEGYDLKKHDKTSLNLSNSESEDEEETIAHADYVCNLLVGDQVTKFYNAVENANSLLRNGTFRINLATTTWKTRDEFCGTKNRTSSFPKSKLGVKLIEITDVLENLLHRDPVLFYTAGDKELLLEALTPLHADLGKLGRKLTRICQRVNEHKITILKLVDLHEKDSDEVVTIDGDESDAESVMNENVILTTPPETAVGYNMKNVMRRLWKLVTCDTMPEDANSKVPSRHGEDQTSYHLVPKGETMKLRSVHVSPFVLHTRIDRSTHIPVSIKDLTPPLDTSTLCFISSALTPPASNIGGSDAQKEVIDEWRKQSYENVLNNALPSESSDRAEFCSETNVVYEQYILSSIQNKIEQALYNDSHEKDQQGYDGTCYRNTEKRKEEITVENADTELGNYVSDGVRKQLCKETESNAKDEDCNSIQSNTDLFPQSTFKEPYFARFPLDPISFYRKNISEMHSHVTDAINSLRALETYWLQPVYDYSIPSENSESTKELAELIDCIAFTMNTLEDPLFEHQIYPEDKEDIVTALKTVADSVSECDSSFVTLTRMALEDAQYLHKIIQCFPSDNDFDIVLYDNMF